MDPKLVMAGYWIDMSIAVHSEGQNEMKITDTVEKNSNAVFYVGLLPTSSIFLT